MFLVDDLIEADEIQRSRNEATDDKQWHEPWDVRTVWISDTHLGSHECQADRLVGFLNHVNPKRIYVVGDGIEGWGLSIRGLHNLGLLFDAQSKPVFPQAHIDAVQKLLRHARHGAYIIYIPGNHDDFLRFGLQPLPDMPDKEVRRWLDYMRASQEVSKIALSGMVRNTKHLGDDSRELMESFNNIAKLGHLYIVPHAIHKTADGRRLLVMHGDEWDFVLKNWRKAAIFGTKVRNSEAYYKFSEWLSRNDSSWPVRFVARKLVGLPENFSFAEHIRNHKSSADAALPYSAIHHTEAHNEVTIRRQGTEEGWEGEPLIDGIICGHNHQPEMRVIRNLQYFNTGDFVSNCTGLIEHHDGRMQLASYVHGKGLVPFPLPPERDLTVSKPQRFLEPVMA